MTPDDPSRAAEAAVDPDRLLPGEDPQSPYPDDARHWLATYVELVDAKRRLMATAQEEAVTAGSAGAADELENDNAILDAELARLERRKRFWEERVAGLEH